MADKAHISKLPAKPMRTASANWCFPPDFPNSVCGVVSQKRQFAPGVMTKSMTDRGLPLAIEAATAVLQGERHPLISKARFFHATCPPWV